MRCSFALAALLAALPVAAATAQTTRPTAAVRRAASPAPPPPAASLAPATTDVEGIYVAPGMTGAPRQEVTTDYNNHPIRQPARRQPTPYTLSSDVPAIAPVAPARPPGRN